LKIKAALQTKVEAAMDPSVAHQELRAIRGLMADSQAYLAGTWRHQLAWGCLTMLGLLGTWGSTLYGAYSVVPWLWAAVLGGGWSWSILVERARTPPPVRNSAGRAFAGIWMGTGVALTLTGTVAVWSGSLAPAALPGMLAVLFGAGYFASGFLAGLGWMGWLALAWWLGGAALLWWPGPHALLGLAVMVLLLEVTPALVLRERERVHGARRVP
jgi:hypothetical protein